MSDHLQLYHLRQNENSMWQNSADDESIYYDPVNERGRERRVIQWLRLGYPQLRNDDPSTKACIFARLFGEGQPASVARWGGVRCTHKLSLFSSEATARTESTVFRGRTTSRLQQNCRFWCFQNWLKTGHSDSPWWLMSETQELGYVQGLVIWLIIVDIFLWVNNSLSLWSSKATSAIATYSFGAERWYRPSVMARCLRLEVS